MPKQNIILDETAVRRKLERIAYEILENNYEEKELLLIGIRDNGFKLAERLREHLANISKLNVTATGVRLNKTNPTSQPIELDIDPKTVKGKTVILVDDVAQSGKTLLYALQPLLEHSPGRIQVAVLVDRKHKKFPVTADYVGMLLSTGMQEQVILEMNDGMYAYLS
jgi:pyrimidine operon attenuation protein / uracil phosphoribosyltransferase